jgi:hypothetical protein
MSRLQRHQMAQYRPSVSQVGEPLAVPETAPRTTGRIAVWRGMSILS